MSDQAGCGECSEDIAEEYDEVVFCCGQTMHAYCMDGHNARHHDGESAL